MKIALTEQYLPIYEALASGVRLKIINLLSKKSMNLKEIAAETGLSSAIITMHIKKLEKAELISTERIHQNGAVHKLCTLTMDSLEIPFPKGRDKRNYVHEFSLPVGHYTDFDISPTCGLATTDKLIGYFDDPKSFLIPERVNAKILWFTKGFMEYKIPNNLLSTENPISLEISMEIGSEAPGVNSNWPSDISFIINGINVGTWTSPGDFGDIKGRYTPGWWHKGVNQYGLLKLLKIDDTGTYMDGEKISTIVLDKIHIRKPQWTLRFEVSDTSKNIGGLTLFGSGFGNYDQDIQFRLYYN